MTKISNKTAYPQQSPLTLNDYFPITDASTSGKVTKTTTLEEVQNLLFAGLSPEIGGTLKITPVDYNGELTSPAAVANQLTPALIIAQYEVVIFSVNGDKYVLKLQDLTIGIAQPAISDSDFIMISGFAKLGTGINVLKGFNSSTGKQEFYAIKSTGLDVSIVTGDIVIESKAGANLGVSGQAIYKGLNSTSKIHEFYKIDSSDFTITLEDNIVKINNPVVVDTPRFYVNSGYDIGGTAPETGSPSKPFKTIQGAIDAFIGEGTAQNPEFEGSEIIIQKGIGYTFTGDFVLNGATIILEEGTEVTSNPGTGTWLCDYDTLSTTQSAVLSIIVNQGASLILNKNGFRNKGTSINNNAFADVKLIRISGTGTILQNVVDTSNFNYTILESNYVTTNTFKNDSSGVFEIQGVSLSALTQQIYKVGGNSLLVFDEVNFFSGNAVQNVNVNLKCFDAIGGEVRKSFCLIGAANQTARDVLYSLSKSSLIPCTLLITDSVFSANVDTLLKNETSLQSTVNMKSCKTTLSSVVDIAKSPNTKWINLFAYNCIFDSGSVDYSEVDLTANNTISSSNIFGGKLTESLQIFGSRALAVAGGLAKGNVFVNRKTVNAGSFVVGVEYQILTIGTTDFTAIGASANTVGINFTASGVGTGTGTAYAHTLDILI